jgi:hypothetical protein
VGCSGNKLTFGADVTESGDDTDYARSMTESGILVSICLYCEQTIAAKAIPLLLLAERTHNCPEKREAKSQTR